LRAHEESRAIDSPTLAGRTQARMYRHVPSPLHVLHDNSARGPSCHRLTRNRLPRIWKSRRMSCTSPQVGPTEGKGHLGSWLSGIGEPGPQPIPTSEHESEDACRRDGTTCIDAVAAVGA